MSDERPSSGLNPGDEVSHYRILDRLGSGGMGEVLLAEDKNLGRQVAIKVLPSEFVSDTERLERFRREARTVASINHPNIVTIYAIEEYDGFRFLSMERVQGKTLRESTPDHGVDLDTFFGIAIPLIQALGAAHDSGIIHRDLKPENIMITDSGVVKVLDFGLAKLSIEGGGNLMSTLSEALTQDGCILGTVPYMSPEQLRGKTVDHRSDIFSMGIVCFEMLTGQRPFKGETAAELMSSILRDSPSSIPTIRPDVPDGIDAILSQCLAKEPDKRIQSASELAQRLATLQRDSDLQATRRSDEQHFIPASSTSTRAMPKSTGLAWVLGSKVGLLALTAAVFAANLIETTLEGISKSSFTIGSDTEFQLASAAHWIEGGWVVVNHDAANALAVYGYSISYFLIFPLLITALGAAFTLRRSIEPLRVFVLSMLVAYAISLPFFLFFPMPERWAFPESGAILLSDLWSSRLIEAIRPISGLDNCFPSSHTSLTVIVILLGFIYRCRARLAILFLGATVILSTLVLGIHWMVDVIAGIGVALLAVALARRLDRKVDGDPARS